MILKTSTDSAVLNKLVKAIIPTLTYDLYKGQCGRIGVVGGSAEYTGAPYFAAISALKMGADLAHVFCPREAAPVIKSYSPELIVYPVLNHDTPLEKIKEPMQRMHSYVMGPGLGRTPEAGKIFQDLVAHAADKGNPLVIDADGLYFVAQSPSMLQNVRRAVITPNEVEFGRIYKAVLKASYETTPYKGSDAKSTVLFRADCTPAKEGEKAIEETRELCKRLGNVTIVRKGAADLITDGTEVFLCDASNSPRRCGGQGDLLSGSMGTFLHWAVMTAESGSKDADFKKYHPSMIAAYAACLLTRHCNRLAFERLGRSTTTADMIESIHIAMKDFPSGSS